MKAKLVALILLILPFGSAAQDLSLALALAQAPGVIALMRHALAPGTGDPTDFQMGDCSTQRTLSDKGRDQARAIGQALRDQGVTFDLIWTSQWCRTSETATLLDLGPVLEKPPLNSFFQGRGSRDDQTLQLRQDLAALPNGTRVLLVSHQVNIRALTGQSTRSGEILLATRSDTGDLTITGNIYIAP